MLWLAYAVTCSLLHHVLARHYADACVPASSSLLAALLPPATAASAYCEVVHKALHVLGASPLLAAAPLLAARPRVLAP